jgi:oligopeptide/dipeptide ABC transporter ATP-binding protein
MSTLLEVVGLKRYFPVGRRQLLHAVDDVDLTVRAGERLGIVGESGSGKSTLARLIARLLDPTAGTIRFDGRDIGVIPSARFARDPLRHKIQLGFQNADDALNPAFSAERNIAIGLGGTRLTGPIRARVRTIAGEVGLGPEQLSRRPHQLSGGQQARVGIARALISQPRLLILDEPTASLDVSVQATVLRLIDGLLRRQGMTLIFVSHDLDVVRLLCDRILVLYSGRVVEIGPVDSVLRTPLHPYTRALVAASPARGRPREIAGEPTSPIDPPTHACLFHGRCPVAIEYCRSKRPALRLLGANQVACHRAEEAAIAHNEISEPAGY